jgi:inner membrane protein
MTGRTHDLAAFTGLVIAFVYLPSLPVMSLPTAIAVFGANFLGGLFPDIDQPTSDLWDNFRLGPFIAKVVCPALGGHRHISHSLVGVVLIGFLSHWVLQGIAALLTIRLDTILIWQAFMIGVVSHLVADLPTKAGVPLLWPLTWKLGIPPFRRFRFESGTWVENLIVFPGLLILTGYLLYTNQSRVLEFLHQYIK